MKKTVVRSDQYDSFFDQIDKKNDQLDEMPHKKCFI